jgi:hypothetical protein
MAFANLNTVPFTKDQLAVAVSHSHIGAGHIGLAFHSAKSGPQVLHLAWHRKLEVDAIPGGLKACWAASVLGVPSSASKQLVAFVRAVATRGATINYAVDFIAAKGSFSQNGNYKAPKNSDGLTCASFVVEALRGGMVNLVKESTWRADPANVEWGNAVCDELAKTADADHIASVRRSLNGLRLRPFEVAGAGALGPARWPAEFDEVQGPAAAVGAALLTICPLPIPLPIPPETTASPQIT